MFLDLAKKLKLWCHSKSWNDKGKELNMLESEEIRPKFSQDLWKKIYSLAALGSVLQADKEALRYETPKKSQFLNSHVIPAVSSQRRIQKNPVSILICDDQFVKSLPKISKIFVDATFDSVPRIPGVYQLLTIMIKINGQVSIKKISTQKLLLLVYLPKLFSWIHKFYSRNWKKWLWFLKTWEKNLRP